MDGAEAEAEAEVGAEAEAEVGAGVGVGVGAGAGAGAGAGLKAARRTTCYLAARKCWSSDAILVVLFCLICKVSFG
ncbi:MAG: hypothetical protein P4L49_03835 [Desulfosporosinus sp.]|nr:hypothetical protein [Desulfosporosinus sp.]